MACFAQTGHAETPVNRCGDSGQPAAAATTTGTGLAPAPNLAAPKPLGAALAAGLVNPKTGGFTLASEDLSLGAGDFPAKLSLVRTYSSDQDGPPGQDYDRDAPYEPGARQPLPFGRGATHNLDMRFEQSFQSFSGQNFVTILIKTGFDTRAFQQCGDGSFVSTRGDGSRLYADSSYPNGGYRYESPLGDVLLFQKINTAPKYYCNKDKVCGVLRKWTAPNGDWAQFDYEEYYSHPTNRGETSYSGWRTNNLYTTSTTECHPNFSGASECHPVLYPTYYTSNETGVPPIPSWPVYNWRLTKVSNSRGYEIRFQYVDSTIDEGGTCAPSGGTIYCTPAKNAGLGRNRLQTATGYWTSPTGASTQIGQASYAYVDCRSWAPDCLSSITAVDGGVTHYAYTSTFGSTATSLAITPPGYAAPITTVNFDYGKAGYYFRDTVRGYYPSGPDKRYQYYHRVTSQTFPDGRTVQYTPTLSNKWAAESTGMWDWPEFISAMQVVAPGSATTVYNYVDQTDDHDGPVAVTDPLNAVTLHTYNSAGAPLSVTQPEGNRTQFTYDARGNVLTTTRYPKPGSAETVLTESFAYTGGATVAAAACPNQKTCNRPISRIDARGFQTDYSWDAATGLPASRTDPADANGLRPTTSYAYGAFAGAGSSTIKLLSTATQKIDATHNLVTSYGYDADIRLAPRESAATADSVTLRTCYNFDLAGNLISQTLPRANLASCP